jgi:large subunit ribosomal protein L23
MTTSQPQNIIIGPIVTEKSILGQSKGIYSFWVKPAANKHQIADAVKAVFGIKSKSVRTSRQLGKSKTDWKKRLPIQKPDRKKAVVDFGKDQKIDMLHLNQK